MFRWNPFQPLVNSTNRRLDHGSVVATLLDGTDIPRLREGVNVLNLPLSAQEGYLFSRIDGILTVDELSETLGFPQEALVDALRRLQELGAIEIVASAAAEAPAATEAARKCAQRQIDPDFKMRIMSMKLALERYNYYQVLGVSPTAERSTIRSAYFTLSKEFHPDVYYGQDLGRFRAMIEEMLDSLADKVENNTEMKL